MVMLTVRIVLFRSKAIPGKTSFTALHPDLMNEWNWINNYVFVDPDEITENIQLTSGGFASVILITSMN